MTSPNGLQRSREERSKEMEQSLYPTNSAVSYSVPCVWPLNDTHNPKEFPCKPAPGIQSLLFSTTDVKLAKLLLHHQQCPGLGCMNCELIRAARIHIMIHQHRCQIWLYLMMVFARHSRECKTTTCPFEFCLFVKHHIHLSGEPILAKHNQEEKHSLEAEFQKCTASGLHGPHMNCNHQSQWTIPMLGEVRPVPKPMQLRSDTHHRQYDDSRTDPVMATLQVVSSIEMHSFCHNLH